MKLGLLAYGLDRSLTGIGRYTVELTRALSDELGMDDITLLIAGKPVSWSEFHHFNSETMWGCSRLPGLLTIGQLILPMMSKRANFDVIHDPSGVTPFFFKAGSTRIVVTVHDAFPWTCPQTSTWAEKRIYRQWLPHILPRVDAVITVSNYSRQAIEQHLRVPSERIHVIPYGVSDKFHRWETDSARTHVSDRLDIHDPFVLFVGALTVRKNIDRALHAFAEIREQIPDIRFVLTGPKTGLPAPVDQVIGKLGIREYVTLTGPLTDLDLPALINRAELLIFPSLSEGFGLPPLEAMACGTPVVCSNTTALPEVVGDAAALIDPLSVSEIAMAMLRILTEPDLAKDLRRKGLQRASAFTWKRTAKQTLGVYQKVLT